MLVRKLGRRGVTGETQNQGVGLCVNINIGKEATSLQGDQRDRLIPVTLFICWWNNFTCKYNSGYFAKACEVIFGCNYKIIIMKNNFQLMI